MSQLNDLELFRALNAEYESKKFTQQLRRRDPAGATARGSRQARQLVRRFKLSGETILEIGCGQGETLVQLAQLVSGQVHGVDIKRRDAWASFDLPNAHVHCCDLGLEIPPEIPRDVDFMYSRAVWEHVLHPTTMMERAFQLLRPGGTFHFIANLYRGPSASHRVREIHFPWPHLLFTDDTIERYYVSIGQKPKRAAWVNRLTAGDYQVLFREVGFEVASLDYTTKPIDEELYRRFEGILGRYPRRDLERNFIEAVLRRPA